MALLARAISDYCAGLPSTGQNQVPFEVSPRPWTALSADPVPLHWSSTEVFRAYPAVQFSTPGLLPAGRQEAYTSRSIPMPYPSGNKRMIPLDKTSGDSIGLAARFYSRIGSIPSIA